MGNLMASKKVSKHVMICGLDGAGKTTLFNLLIQGQPQEPKLNGLLGSTNKKIASETETLGFNFDYSDPHQAASCIGFWDLGGKDSIRAIWSSFYMNIRVSGIIFVVDANDDEDRIVDARMELQKLLNEEELRTAVLYVVFNDKANSEDNENKANEDNPIRKSILEEKVGMNAIHPSVIKQSILINLQKIKANLAMDKMVEDKFALYENILEIKSWLLKQMEE